MASQLWIEAIGIVGPKRPYLLGDADAERDEEEPGDGDDGEGEGEEHDGGVRKDEAEDGDEGGEQKDEVVGEGSDALVAVQGAFHVPGFVGVGGAELAHERRG